MKPKCVGDFFRHFSPHRKVHEEPTKDRQTDQRFHLRSPAASIRGTRQLKETSASLAMDIYPVCSLPNIDGKRVSVSLNSHSPAQQGHQRHELRTTQPVTGQTCEALRPEPDCLFFCRRRGYVLRATGGRGTSAVRGSHEQRCWPGNGTFRYGECSRRRTAVGNANMRGRGVRETSVR